MFKNIFDINYEYDFNGEFKSKIVKILGIKLRFGKKLSYRQMYNKLCEKIEINNALLSNLLDIELEKTKKFKVLSSDETFNLLVNTNKSLARLGDGELRLIFDGIDIGFQKANPKLAYRLLDVLKSDNENLLVGINGMFASPIVPELYTQKPNGHMENIRKIYLHYINKISKPGKMYVNAGITRAGILNRIEKWKSIWKDKDIVIVEGELSRLGVGNDLFDSAKSIKRILCPAKNAWDKYDKILEECKKQPKDKLFVLALGPTATVLAYDLSNLGYRALDVGHLDVCYEWCRNKTNGKTKLRYKYVNEVKNGDIVEDCKDKDYLNQILTKL